jgi:hypothetical protein
MRTEMTALHAHPTSHHDVRRSAAAVAAADAAAGRLERTPLGMRRPVAAGHKEVMTGR